MKPMIVLVLVLLPWLAVAQTKPAKSWSEVEVATFARSFTLGPPLRSYDTIVGERVVYSGIVVQLLRAPQPLHLLNPWAPATCVPRESNLVSDPMTRRPVGWKLFAISF